MAKMESLHFQVTAEQKAEIEKFQKDSQFQARSDAIRYLINLGLKHQEIVEKLFSKKPEEVKKFIE